MKINAKISKFFHEKGISNKEIADRYGGSAQNMWNILNKPNGKVPLEFLIWLVENYPEINMNTLLKPDSNQSLVSEEPALYEKRPATKAEILKEIEGILDKYM